MRTLALAALVIPMLAAVPAFAQDTGSYINFGYTHTEADDLSNGVLTGRYGYGFTPNFAVEGEAGIGVVDDTVAGIDVGTDYTLGAFAVGRVPVAENVTLLGRAGYQHTWAEASLGGISVDEDSGSFAVGVGGEVAITENGAIRADYTRLTEDETNSFSIAYAHKF